MCPPPQTQKMVHKAQQEYPELNANDAIQREADRGPGREAPPGPQDTGSDKSMPQRAKESMQVNESYYISFFSNLKLMIVIGRLVLVVVVGIC